jgi:ribonuclease R
VHRLITDQHPIGDPIPVLITLGHHCSDKEQNAEWAERELIKVKLLHFLNKKIGETMPGVISGVVPEGFYVRGTKFPAEGFVSIKSLPNDRYRYEKRGQVLEGFRSGNRFRLGDELTVKIHEVDLARRELLLTVAMNHTAQTELAGGGPPRKQASGKAHSKKGKKIGTAKHKGNKKKKR